MNSKPFFTLAFRRVVDRPDLPAGLTDFYAGHEGVGLGTDLEGYAVRLCRLGEVRAVGWGDLSMGDTPEGWERFAALRIAAGEFFIEVFYVLHAPSCPRGSVLALGSGVRGPGGEGLYALESSLVLAPTFSSWLGHLEEWGWWEPAISTASEPTVSDKEILRYYVGLNPGLSVDFGRNE